MTVSIQYRLQSRKEPGRCDSANCCPVAVGVDAEIRLIECCPTVADDVPEIRVGFRLAGS